MYVRLNMIHFILVIIARYRTVYYDLVSSCEDIWNTYIYLFNDSKTNLGL